MVEEDASRPPRRHNAAHASALGLGHSALGSRPTRAHLGDVLPDRSLDGFVEADGTLGDFTQRGYARLVVALHERCSPVRELTRTLCPENHKGEAIGDFLQTIFNGYASQWGLQGKVRGPDTRAEAGKVKGRRVYADWDRLDAAQAMHPAQKHLKVVTTLQSALPNLRLEASYLTLSGLPVGGEMPEELKEWSRLLSTGAT
jgi:hypothetical protein